MNSTISVLSKFVIGIIALIAVVGIATASVSVVSEKNMNTVKKASFEPKSANFQRLNSVEGLFWELEDIVLLRDSVQVGQYTLITDIMEALPGYSASYYYSFKDNSVLGFIPIEDPSYAIDLWQQNITNEFNILKEVLPFLRAQNEEYEDAKPEQKSSISANFKSLCASVGIPFPSIAVNSYKWFEYDGIGTSMPSNDKLKIANVDSEHMELAFGKSAILRYVRIKELPKEIAPVTLYFHEKKFFIENYDKLENTSWRASDEEIDAHFRKTFKSKKY